MKPNYINIRTNGNNRQCNNTMKAAIRFCINQEIKFLYIKKQKLNEQLYRLHLNCANYWNKSWPHIQDHLEQRLQKKTEDPHSRLNRKIDNLMDKQRNKTKLRHTTQPHNFYKHTVNLTNITFMKEELNVLNLGLQHSVEKPLRTYWLNLITETENAIKLPDHRLQNAFRIMATNILKQIYNSNNSVKIIHKCHQYILNKIKHKITAGNAMLAQSDKGRTTVIIYKRDYDKGTHIPNIK